MTKLPVGWVAVNKKTGKYYKRPFAYSTQADSFLVETLAEDGYTWNDLRDLPYLSEELITISDRFIEDGFGDTLLSEFVAPLET